MQAYITFGWGVFLVACLFITLRREKVNFGVPIKDSNLERRVKKKYSVNYRQ